MEDTRRSAHRVLERRCLTRLQHPTPADLPGLRDPRVARGASGRTRTAIAVAARPPGEPPRRQPYPVGRTQSSPAPSRVTGQPVLRRPVELRPSSAGHKQPGHDHQRGSPHRTPLDRADPRSRSRTTIAVGTAVAGGPRTDPRFLRKGRVKVRTEWRLHTMTHNLTKLYNHRIATQAA
jgi:hypothetical protein